MLPIREKYEKRLASEVDKLTVDYKIRVDKQNRIAGAISSLSVINLANNLMAEFSATGATEAENFLNQAKQFQEQVNTDVYAKFIFREYFSKGASSSSVQQIAGAGEIKIPLMDAYRYVPLQDVFMNNLKDILLIAAYCLLFFVGAFISFTRFDVR